jgi:hypothetical protein
MFITVKENGKEYDVKIYSYAHRSEQYWRLNGKIHREKGPAVIRLDGYIEWRQNGKPHRLDGPASICADGTKYWCINGIDITEYRHVKVRTMLLFGLDKI